MVCSSFIAPYTLYPTICDAAVSHSRRINKRFVTAICRQRKVADKAPVPSEGTGWVKHGPRRGSNPFVWQGIEACGDGVSDDELQALRRRFHHKAAELSQCERRCGRVCGRCS